MPIETIVVGSFPKSECSLEKAIRKIVDLQLFCGIDVITDGEQRGNIVRAGLPFKREDQSSHTEPKPVLSEKLQNVL